MSEIVIKVEAAPPVKDGSESILGPGHRERARVSALRAALAAAMVDRVPFEGVRLMMEMRVTRARCRADGLNMINGVADVIQKRATKVYAPMVWAIDDDKNIKEFHYFEEPGESDRYQITLRPIER